MELDPRSDRALYRQIADELRAQIKDGRIRPGAAVPSEAALQETYEVSQGTARKALGVLEAERLIEAQKGRGRFVREAQPILRVANDRFLRKNREGTEGKGAFTVELERQGLTPKSEVVVEGPVEPPPDVAELLALGDEEQVVARHRRMLASGEPVQLATSYIPWSIAEGTSIAVPDSGPGGIYARIEESGRRLSEFRETVGARSAQADEADELRIDIGAPVILVSRVALDEDDRPVEVCQHVMNAERYQLYYQFSAN